MTRTMTTASVQHSAQSTFRMKQLYN